MTEQVQEVRNSEGYTEIADAFVVWFLREILEQDETEADENAAVQGRGDQGVDAYWQDNREEQVFAVQSKYSESGDEVFDDAPIQELKHGIECLRDLSRATNPNAVFVENSRQFREAVDAGFRINAVVVIFGERGPRFRAEEGELANWLRTEYGGNAEVKVYDAGRLYSAHQEILSRAEEPEISASLTVSNGFGFEINGISAVAGTCSLLDLVKLFWERKFSLFEKNPRYQLHGNNKVNQGIKATVTDEDEASRFWLYNNGITAICSRMELNEGNLAVENFQVVNGCQTIATAAHAIDEMRARTEGGGIPDHVQGTSVLLRVIQTEDDGIASAVSRYTNSQSVVTDADRRSDDDVQRRLARLCDDLDPSWYYERKRGGWRAIPTGERGRKYGRGSRKRLLKREDAAKIRLSFAGDPVTARTKARLLFDPDEEYYGRIFDQRLYAEHYVVPWRFYQEFRKLVNGQREALTDLQQLQEQADNGLSTEQQIKLDQLTASKYGTYHLVALVGHFIRQKYGGESRNVLRFLFTQDLQGLASEVFSRGIWLLGGIVRDEEDIQNYFKRPKSWEDLQRAAITRIGEAQAERRDYLEFLPEFPEE